MPQGYPEAYYAPGWGAPPPPRTDPVAVTSLVTGVLGLGPVALVLGLVGLRRTRRGRVPARRGRGLAVAGTVLGVVGTVVGAALVAFVAVTTVTSRPLPPDVTEPVDARAVQLVTGSCLETLPPDGEVDRVRVVPCADPHAAQVLTDYRFDRGARWPGAEEAAAAVAAACTLTPDEVAQGLRVVAWSPTEASWRQGDRTGLCVGVLPDPVTGSLLDGSAAPVG